MKKYLNALAILVTMVIMWLLFEFNVTYALSDILPNENSLLVSHMTELHKTDITKEIEIDGAFYKSLCGLFRSIRVSKCLINSNALGPYTDMTLSLTFHESGVRSHLLFVTITNDGHLAIRTFKDVYGKQTVYEIVSADKSVLYNTIFTYISE